jgi:uncharacterized protein (TIGR02757 family)
MSGQPDPAKPQAARGHAQIQINASPHMTSKNPNWLHDVKDLLEAKVAAYNQPMFIEDDPVAVPHQFVDQRDVEIAGFLTATIAWGNRKSILQNARKLMGLMGDAPYDFVMSASEGQLAKLAFVHRTFNAEDLRYFIVALRHLYTQHGGMQAVFEAGATPDSMQPAITHFKEVFFSLPHPTRTRKHVSDPAAGSAAKRLNMMLRWFVRKDQRGVDLGIWQGVLKPAQLSCPLDVHSGNVARKLGLLTRKQNDAKALMELDAVLRSFDPVDPVKYDYALFGLGAIDGF